MSWGAMAWYGHWAGFRFLFNQTQTSGKWKKGGQTDRSVHNQVLLLVILCRDVEPISSFPWTGISSSIK